jgi:mxaJ protein
VRVFRLGGGQPSAQRAVDAIVRGEIDAAVLWGPQAGYFARHAGVPLRVARLPAPADAHFDFAIAMGVRRADAALREKLADFIRRRQADIDRILADYDVPRVEATP